MAAKGQARKGCQSPTAGFVLTEEGTPSEADVSILDAVILAQWALEEFPQEARKQRIFY